MAALDYLHTRGLHAEPLPGNQLSVWPADLITSEVRLWIRDHKLDLLRELVPANDDRRMAWRVLNNGKPFTTMCGKLYTHDEAQEAAQSRWPNENIEVIAHD